MPSPNAKAESSGAQRHAVNGMTTSAKQHFKNGAYRALLIPGSRLRGPKNPKTRLGYIWADNILYFIPESQKSYPRKPERPNHLKKSWHKWKIQFFGDLVFNSTGICHQKLYGISFAILWWKCIQIICSIA